MVMSKKTKENRVNVKVSAQSAVLLRKAQSWALARQNSAPSQASMVDEAIRVYCDEEYHTFKISEFVPHAYTATKPVASILTEAMQLYADKCKAQKPWYERFKMWWDERNNK